MQTHACSIAHWVFTVAPPIFAIKTLSWMVRHSLDPSSNLRVVPSLLPILHAHPTLVDRDHVSQFAWMANMYIFYVCLTV